MIDPTELIKQQEPGTATYAVTTIDGVRQTALLIREDPIRIKAISNPPVQIRAGLFTERTALVVALLVEINGELYETWWNYHQPTGQDPFELMSVQDHLPILFYNARDLAKSIRIPNSQRAFFVMALAKIAARPAWNMEGFDQARALIEARNNTVKALWRVLRPIKPAGQ